LSTDNGQVESVDGTEYQHTKVVALLRSANCDVLTEAVGVGRLADELDQAHLGLRETPVVFDESADAARTFEVVRITILV
jgi:hypothetical protein